MSLVIAARDRAIGIAISEGRAVAYVNGSKVPVCEDASKLSRLADGSILALTGGLRDGYETTTMRGESVSTEPLRRDIHAAAETRTFPEICAIIPDLLAKYRATYPELGFAVSLVGNDGGKVRMVSWSSGRDEIECREDSDADMTSNVIGLSNEANKEASRAVREYFMSAKRDYLHINETFAAFRKIIEDLASRHVELNDHIRYEAVVASEEEREVFDITRMLACTDGSNVTTAARVSTSKATITGGSVSVPYNTLTALPGLAWTVSPNESNKDTYNISGFLQASGNMAGELQSSIYIYVDGNQATNYGDGGVYAVIPGSTVSPFMASGSFLGVVSGLSAGTHTIQVYMNQQKSGGGSLGVNGFAFCQDVKFG